MRALENEMLLRIRKQGLDVSPKILIVCDSKNPPLTPLLPIALTDITNEILALHFIEY